MIARIRAEYLWTMRLSVAINLIYKIAAFLDRVVAIRASNFPTNRIPQWFSRGGFFMALRI